MKIKEKLKNYFLLLYETLKKFSNYVIDLIKKYIVPFLFCYILGIGLLLVASNSINIITVSLLINLASSLFLIPLIFLVYTSYNEYLVRDSITLINKMLDEKINAIFLKYLYFSAYFYNSHENFSNSTIYDLPDLLKKDSKTIFIEIINLEYGGYFLFGDFDRFDEEVEDVLDSITIHKYVGVREIAILHNFINTYRELLECFKTISLDNIVSTKDKLEIEISKSIINKSDDLNEKFFDIKDDSNVIFYSSKYRIFDSNILKFKYRFSSEKADEVSESIYNTYSVINKWFQIRKTDDSIFNDGFISAGRLFPSSTVLINFHFKDSISLKSKFK